jgi:hypothetical protein
MSGGISSGFRRSSILNRQTAFEDRSFFFETPQTAFTWSTEGGVAPLVTRPNDKGAP